ncbi:hypothetical protein CPB83DRAFT_763129 [Crepidotus variabilis]|uniref:Phosphatidate phosphatase APP1 catalytic domain-containing protein n=1 Tax=Crepidotus variabilis TaxID=179855 RepID=A0A9P6JSI8_9AGAR|nr:hypothetical protein CPB83DRAFT_763129 [Crepidotus variabilis]
MQLFKLAIISSFFAAPTLGAPVVEIAYSERGLIDGIHITDNLILFDAPAFPNPNNGSETLVDVETYAFSRIASFGSVIPVEVQLLVKALSALGVDAAQKVVQIEERVKLFLAIGLPAKSEHLKVDGCSNAPNTGATDLGPDLGLSDATLSLGKCDSGKQSAGSIGLDVLDTRTIANTIYFSPNSGFGVISDIDDTIKVSNVLDKAKLAEATLIDDPVAVAGMPQLYSSLAQSLPDPQFIYITGSPFQLYPFLNGFVKSSFAASAGPIWTRKLTLTNPSDLVSLIGGGDKTLDNKVSQIDRLHALYPNKKWLAIGDSTEKDPEVYATMYDVLSSSKYPDFIACIWIRKVDGAANNQTRFDTAFQGIPQEKTKVFTDQDISSLSSIRVANGECTSQ